ncbi:isoleucine--tRNA ligase [Clostridium sp. CAG:571]|jgi:isoleucyl-tRNA synthetase|nr:isoleucine--tRNA ligase [Clostridium sp. CAG:571]HJJ06187.1 isoleucine--tRNA ligase [Clostridiaceae bacterium]
MCENCEPKKDYGKTLNLPKTDFPMRGNLPENEPKIFEEIFEKGLYEKMLKKNAGKEPFVLHDGPPYANGEIHTGHALNKVLKDTIVRYKNLKGYYTPFVPGFDTHGMPTEKKAIEKLGLNRDEIPVVKFRDTCKEFNKEYIKKQTEGFKRLGAIGDWENPYITYQPQMEAKQIGVFGNMYKKGYIYKGLKPVYWCTDCETALAEAEIEYKDIKSNTAYVKFPVIEGKGLFDERDTYVVIWTTTPWTLPGNTGITISPEFKYSLVDVQGEKLIMASELVDKVMEVAKIDDYSVIKEYEGNELEGVICKHPFIERESRVVLGSDDTILVELDTGTGAVHTAPGYGKEDYLCGLKNKLDMVVTVDSKGHQTEEAGPFAGMYYAKSDKEIIKWLDEHNFLLAKQEITHSYPHCWRCKHPVIYRATSQWFASIDGFRKEALEAIKDVKWYPTWGEERITKMIEDRNDWCISRQRTWGVPLPIFYCKDCEKEYVTSESLDKVQKIVEKNGSNAWFELTEKELMPEGAKCTECGCTEFVKETDIMDVWFDSGSTHESVLAERGLPEANLYLEGSDQYRGWFQSSLLTSVATKGKAPYKEVVTHGYVVDEKGRKMSKSLGNGIDPMELINEFGADILRLWALSSDYTSDVSISKGIIKQVAEVYRKIRNTARFILGNISDFDVNNPVSYEELQEIDKWALTKLNKLIEDCSNAYDGYDFKKAYQAINQFCVVDMSNFYLDIIKDRLYTEKLNSIERRAAQTTMYEILQALVRILAPMTCFTAEEIWKFMPHKDNEKLDSVMLSYYPEINEKYNNKELEEKWNKIIKIKELVSKKLEEARSEKVIGHSLNAKVTLYAEKDEYEFLLENKELLMTVFIVSGLEIEKNERKNEEKIGVKVEVADGKKCERCWMYSTTVGEDKENPNICHRCSEALK